MKRSMKCLSYIVLGLILQTAIILVIVLTFMRIRNPKVRLNSVSLQNLQINSSTSSPSFTFKLNAQVTIKNTNFGHYKFDNATVTVSYRGSPVGEAVIEKARAKARSTKKMNITVAVSSKRVSSGTYLGSDLNSGKVTLTSQATVKGKVHLFKIIKKKKSAKMDCTMDVNTKTKAIENLHCK